MHAFCYPLLKLDSLNQQHRGCNVSDFHEMATHMRVQEERSLLMENHTYMLETNGRHKMTGRRQFSYSEHLAKNAAEIDFSILSEIKTEKNPGAESPDSWSPPEKNVTAW